MESSNDQDLARLKRRLREYSVLTNEDNILYILSVTQLKKLHIESWEYNRPYDKKRVKAISKHYKTGGVIDGIIYLAEIKHKLVCYDGNHRRLAIESFDARGSAIVDIMWTTSNQAVCDRFNLINLSVSVPTLYLETKANKLSSHSKADTEKLRALVIKTSIIDYVSSMCVKYDTFMSSKVACKRPNFNRDMFMQDITDLYEDNENTLAILSAMNVAYKQQKYGFSKYSLSDIVRIKCKSGGLWLFCEDRRINKAYFNKVAKKEGL